MAEMGLPTAWFNFHKCFNLVSPQQAVGLHGIFKSLPTEIVPFHSISESHVTMKIQVTDQPASLFVMTYCLKMLFAMVCHPFIKLQK